MLLHRWAFTGLESVCLVFFMGNLYLRGIIVKGSSMKLRNWPFLIRIAIIVILASDLIVSPVQHTL